MKRTLPPYVALAALALSATCCRYLDPKPQPSTNDGLPPLPTSGEGHQLNPAPAPTAPTADIEPAVQQTEPATAEAGIRATGEPGRGRLPKAALEAGVAAGMPAIQGCYTRALRQVPHLAGNVYVSFVVAPDGNVPYAAALAQGTDLPHPAAVDCILSEFRRLHFAAPEGGRALVNYPLRFAPSQPGDSQPGDSQPGE